MAGVITTGNHPKALWPGVKAWWGRSYDEYKMQYMDLFDKEMSYKNYEEDVQLTGFGLAPIKTEGESTFFDSESQGYVSRYTHAAVSLGYVVTREEIADSLYEDVSRKRVKALAFSMRQTKENIGANIYNRATDATFTYGDGVELLSDSHPTLDGTQSNIAAVPADLSETSLEDLIIQIMNAKNTRGHKISLQADSLHIPTQLWFEANRILGSVLQNDTGNNAVNVLNATSAVKRGVFVNNYFTDPDAWFIRTNAPRGMICYQREEIEFEKDNDFSTSNALAKAYERYSFGNTDWRGIYGNPGA
jgi:hypothetical protein